MSGRVNIDSGVPVSVPFRTRVSAIVGAGRNWTEQLRVGEGVGKEAVTDGYYRQN
jgi:hypothetical protein